MAISLGIASSLHCVQLKSQHKIVDLRGFYGAKCETNSMTIRENRSDQVKAEHFPSSTYAIGTR